MRQGHTAQRLMLLHAEPARQANIWIASPRRALAKDARQAHQLFRGLPHARIAHEGNIPCSEAQRVLNVLQGFIPAKVQRRARIVLQVDTAQAVLASAQYVLRATIHMLVHQCATSAGLGTSHRCMRPHAKSALQILSVMRKLKHAHCAQMDLLQVQAAKLVRR